jgi:hypothetical protein
MHSALVIIKKPSDENREVLNNWRNAIGLIANIQQGNAGIEELTEGVLLIPFASGPSSFVKILRYCDEFLLTYRILFFREEKDISWVSTPDCGRNFDR